LLAIFDLTFTQTASLGTRRLALLCRDGRAEGGGGLRQTGLMAVPDWAALAGLGAGSRRQLSLGLGLAGARAGAVRAALVVVAGPAGRLAGGLPGVAGRWPVLAVTGW
jgi:hypothetical protein